MFCKKNIRLRWLFTCACILLAFQNVYAEISKEQLIQEVVFRVDRVIEFKRIRELASELKIKDVYLFGGTAAAWIHYVYWDLQRENGWKVGERRLLLKSDHFDYDYNSIFRSNQDIDLVIDGTPEQAQKLENRLNQEFQIFQGEKEEKGEKSVWEVRLLKSSMGDKEALLDNPSFLNQNTDSNSTGLIRLTNSGSTLGAIRDLKDWKNVDNNHFINNTINENIHYYYNPTAHANTNRYKEGKNPPIFSVIRYLTKVFQYKLKIPLTDLENIRTVINEFNGDQDLRNRYAKDWIEINAKKLIQNAIDVEYAVNMLDQLGLRKKLREINNNINTTRSLAWWMNKEPLRTRPLASPCAPGKTAGELGINIVAHETNSFAAYESIVKAHTGEPNVFISRQGFAGEAAAFGNGFYTSRGRFARGITGITIRFKVDPKACEGKEGDFELFGREGSGPSEYILFKNRSALEVIPESLNLTPVEYFKLLQIGFNFDHIDETLRKKIHQKIYSRHIYLTLQEIEEINKIILSSIDNKNLYEMLYLWFQLPISIKFPQLLEELLLRNTKDTKLLNSIIRRLLSEERWSKMHEMAILLIKLIKADKACKLDDIAKIMFVKPYWENHPELLKQLIETNKVNAEIAKYVLSEPCWKDHPELVELLIKTGNVNEEIARYVLSKSQWEDHPEWVELLIKTGKFNHAIDNYVLSKPHWKKYYRTHIGISEQDVTSSNIKKILENRERVKNNNIRASSGNSSFNNVRSAKSVLLSTNHHESLPLSLQGPKRSFHKINNFLNLFIDTSIVSARPFSIQQQLPAYSYPTNKIRPRMGSLLPQALMKLLRYL